jgi:hypothetical protein
LTSSVAGSAASARRTWLGDSASPPVNSWRSPASSPGSSSTTELNSAAVSHAEVTPCAAIARASPRPVGIGSRYTTQAPPCSSGPHSSSVDASNPSGAAWRNRVSVSSRT